MLTIGVRVYIPQTSLLILAGTAAAAGCFALAPASFALGEAGGSPDYLSKLEHYYVCMADGHIADQFGGRIVGRRQDVHC